METASWQSLELAALGSSPGVSWSWVWFSTEAEAQRFTKAYNEQNKKYMLSGARAMQPEQRKDGNWAVHYHH